jgi:hypothetical protein
VPDATLWRFVSRRMSLAKSLGDCLADDAKHAFFDGAPVSQIRVATPIE